LTSVADFTKDRCIRSDRFLRRIPIIPSPKINPRTTR
jgi:hypothetical protein